LLLAGMEILHLFILDLLGRCVSPSSLSTPSASVGMEMLTFVIEQRHSCCEDLPNEIRRGLSSQHGGDSIVQDAVLGLCDFLEHWLRFVHDAARVATRRALAGE
jgi:hypothetical protein